MCPDIVFSLHPDLHLCGAPRPDKGKSLLTLLDEYIAIDIETTGFDSRFDGILEIGAVRMSQGQEVERFQSLVNPEMQISSFIAELTRITDEMVRDAPSVNDVLPQFMQFIGGTPLVGHNVNFDINFLYDYTRMLSLPPLTNDFVDTMRLSRRLFPEWPNHKLSTVATQLGVGDSTEHRALADCLQTAQCYELLMQHVRNQQICLDLTWENFNSMSKYITPQGGPIDPSNPIFGKVFAFTGTLEKMPRREAMQHVVDMGGICGDGVTAKTNFLVLGATDYSKGIKGGKSNKQKKAETLCMSGQDIAVISENVFYEMLDM